MNTNAGEISRRTFFASLAGTLAAVWLAPAGLRAAEKSAPTNLARKAIPSTNETLPVIGLGSWETFDIGSDRVALNGLAEVLRAFFDLGGELIDSSPMYGSAELVIGELLKRVGNHDKLFAATKVWTDGRQAGISQMGDSLRKWGLARFDLMQIHNLRDWQIHLRTLKDWKTEGKIRYLGITTSHGRFHRELEEILRREPFDFVQFSYNIEDRAVEARLLPLAVERGLGVIINRPFQGGALFRRVKGMALPDWAADIDCTSWGQLFLKFIVSHPAVTCVIPATSKVEHLQDNMTAGFSRMPDIALRKRMAAYFAAL